MTGQTPHRSDILNITNALPCEVQTTAEHGYSTLDFVRLTNLNGMIPVPRGVPQLNDNKYRIIVTGLDTFTLQDPITYEPIDSRPYPPYVEGGYCNRIATDFFYNGDT